MNRRTILKGATAVVDLTVVPAAAPIVIAETQDEHFARLWRQMTPDQKEQFVADLEEEMPELVQAARLAVAEKGKIGGAA